MRLLTRADVPFVATLAASIVLYLSAWFDFGRVPYEDAAMLMRYASHVAEGQGIVWNVGEAPEVWNMSGRTAIDFAAE